MKVLYVGYYCEKGEWGRAAINNILALEQAGVDVVCRAIQFAHKQCPPELLHLQAKDAHDCDILIQHVFPEHLVGSKKFKLNIAILANVVYDVSKSSWAEQLELVDQVWVQTWLGACSLQSCNSRLNIHKIPQAIDTSIFTRSPDINIPAINNKFKFYTIGSLSDAEGLEQVLRTFHAEFRKTDPVALLMVLYTSSPEDTQKTSKFMEELSTKVKTQLKLEKDVGNYVQDMIITSEEMSPELLDIHAYADQYISCNRGLNMPLQEYYAVGYGSRPILSEKHQLGIDSTAIRTCATILKTHLSPVGGMFDEVDNGNNYRVIMCDADLREQIVAAFNSWKKSPVEETLDKKNRGLFAIKEFSMGVVGNQMKELINGSL